MASDKEKPAKTITVVIDGDDYEVEEREMTVAELLELVELDPAQSYLIELKGQGNEVNHEDPDETLKLHEGMRFLTGDRGPGQFA